MALRSSTSPYQARGHRRTVAPAAEPVTATELRAFLREDPASMPDEIAELYITQAREFLEEMTGLAFIQQTWLLTLDNWPGYVEPWWDGVRQTAISELSGGAPRVVDLPRYPLMSVDDVTVYDEGGLDTVVTVASVFDIDTQQTPGRLGLKFGQLWPQATQTLNAIEITYDAGFGDEATEVPALLRGAVLDLAGYYYSHRGECDLATAATKSGALAKASMFASRGM